MRFSLATLLLLVLLAASTMTVWVRREPWRLDSDTYTLDALLLEASRSPDEPLYYWKYSPDGRREASRINSDDRIPRDTFAIRERQGPVLYILPTQTPFCSFLTDDLLALAVPHDYEYMLYRRRFPEWWWGHFYRPEVWAALVLGIALMFRAFRARRRKAIGSAQQ